jgi:hypothetical protein
MSTPATALLHSYPSSETDSFRPLAAAALAIPDLAALIFSAYCSGIRADFHPPGLRNRRQVNVQLRETYTPISARAGPFLRGNVPGTRSGVQAPSDPDSPQGIEPSPPSGTFCPVSRIDRRVEIIVMEDDGSRASVSDIIPAPRPISSPPAPRRACLQHLLHTARRVRTGFWLRSPPITRAWCGALRNSSEMRHEASGQQDCGGRGSQLGSDEDRGGGSVEEGCCEAAVSVDHDEYAFGDLSPGMTIKP